MVHARLTNPVVSALGHSFLIIVSPLGVLGVGCTVTFDVWASGFLGAGGAVPLALGHAIQRWREAEDVIARLAITD